MRSPEKMPRFFRLPLFALLAVALVAVAFSSSGLRQADAQQEDLRKQTLIIHYPTTGIVISSALGAPRYTGVIYVKVFPITPDLVTKYGAGPIASAELSASQRDVRQLPLGEYEVRFSMRQGGELKTYILRDVILRADRGNTITVEMNADTKTTVIGGDMTAQEMADSVRQLQNEVADLKQQVTDLKKK